MTPHVAPQLEGRVIAVTGTSKGIGRGIAQRLIDAGASVVGAARTEPARGTFGERYVHLPFELRRDSADRLLDAALEAFGRVDGLVNNAGVNHFADCWMQSDEELDDMIAVNLTAPFRLSQAFARHWAAERAPGVVLNICSVESQVAWPKPGQAGYAATKGALLALTRAMALDLAAHGIRVVAIGPGVIDSEMTPTESDAAPRIPLGHASGSPHDVGDAAVFLLSSAARYITGEILYVDGGYLVP